MSYVGKNAFSAGKTSGVLRGGASGASRGYVLTNCAPRGGKSVAIWQPSCQKVFEESGSGRKFLDPSPALSHTQTNPWKRKRIDISIFRKLGYLHLYTPVRWVGGVGIDRIFHYFFRC